MREVQIVLFFSKWKKFEGYSTQQKNNDYTFKKKTNKRVKKPLVVYTRVPFLLARNHFQEATFKYLEIY